MEIYQLKHFYTTAKNGNMTKAANELLIAQPALSKSIRNLEAEFGAALFFRSNKGMALTVQGEILFRYCEQIFSLVENATREIHESIHFQTKIHLCLRSGSEMIGTSLSSFVHEHPDVSLDISEASVNNWDFLIDSASSTDLPEDAVTLLSEEVCLAVSSSHPLAQYSVVPLSALAQEKLIVLSTSASFQQIMNQLLKKADIAPNITYSCSNNNLLQELVSMNMGISIAASVNWAHSNPPENIRLIPFEGHPCRLIYYKKSGSFPSETMQAFECNLVSHFRNLSNQTSF